MSIVNAVDHQLARADAQIAAGHFLAGADALELAAWMLRDHVHPANDPAPRTRAEPEGDD